MGDELQRVSQQTVVYSAVVIYYPVEEPTIDRSGVIGWRRRGVSVGGTREANGREVPSGVERGCRVVPAVFRRDKATTNPTSPTSLPNSATTINRVPTITTGASRPT